MSETETELKPKPCPFCGAAAEILVPSRAAPEWEVRCSADHQEEVCFFYETQEGAIAAWNRRVEPERQGVE